MSMVSSYLNILENSLIKKKKILSDIEEANRAQSELFNDNKLDMEKYDKLVDCKATYIKELEELDVGFEALYQKIKQELLQNKALYADQIKCIQDLIGEITEKSVSIQAQESRNKDLVTAFFKQERQVLGQGRRFSKAAYGYYQNLSKAVQEETRVMDMKK